MTPDTPTYEMKTPLPTRITPRSAIMSVSNALNLINEALSRSRTRSPQTINSEAHRSARRVAIEARRQQARELGNLSLYGVR
jgi:hypothetical protein